MVQIGWSVTVSRALKLLLRAGNNPVVLKNSTEHAELLCYSTMFSIVVVVVVVVVLVLLLLLVLVLMSQSLD